MTALNVSGNFFLKGLEFVFFAAPFWRANEKTQALQ